MSASFSVNTSAHLLILKRTLLLILVSNQLKYQKLLLLTDLYNDLSSTSS